MTIEILTETKDQKDEYLTRFLGLHKFISLLRKKTLYFTRLDLLPDPFEGITTTLLKQRMFASLIPSREKMNPRLPSEAIENNLNQKASIEKQYSEDAPKKQKSQFVNCWFRGDRESMAMWDLYSNKECVALKIIKTDLISYIEILLDLQPLLYPKNKMICGPVEYCNLNPIDLDVKINVKYSAFKKDVAYNFENEYRILMVTPTSYSDKNPPSLELNITDRLLNNTELICHPGMTEWQIDDVKHLCKNIKFQNVRKSLIELK